MREWICSVMEPLNREWKFIAKQELIRCRDCKYNDDGECIIKAGWFPVKPDWFCADGERKDEDEEEDIQTDEE